MHRSFTVFNVAQIEELPKEDVSETIIPEDAASTFVAAALADIRVGGDMAGYIPSKDYITLPPSARIGEWLDRLARGEQRAFQDFRVFKAADPPGGQRARRV